ncbi:precorrin-4 C(11)-methyltransferase [Ligaoa zhengdingensis]|uniref:precorrin-4 C(11)-methyltransferase n=1 Tax=Ligaoa zhengdingensis TaxID=2763658 RepID=UPI0031BA1FE6
MIHFVGAGSGAPDLITVRGQRLLREADVVIYAGSLVNPELLREAKPSCTIYDSARMTLEQVIAAMQEAEACGKTTVRLHTGDPSIYGAIREQMDELERLGVDFDVTPGVSSFCGAAASLKAEYTLPDVTQTVIITRMAGRTPVPEREELSRLAAHGATMALFLSAGMLPQLRERLLAGGAYTESTPAAIVYKATWPEERQVVGTVGELPEMARRNGIDKTALVLVGDFLGNSYERSKLYDPAFTTGYRRAEQQPTPQGGTDHV